MNYNNHLKGISFKPRISQNAIDYLNERGIKVYKKNNNSGNTAENGFITVASSSPKTDTGVAGNTTTNVPFLSEKDKKSIQLPFAPTSTLDTKKQGLMYKDNKTASVSDPVPEISASTIKNGVKEVLTPKYGELNTRHLFEDVKDSDINKFIPMASEAVGVAQGKFPNLNRIYAMALSYAADAVGNASEASKAREASYNEKLNFSNKPTEKNGLSKMRWGALAKKYSTSGNALPKTQDSSDTKSKSGARYVNTNSSTLKMRDIPGTSASKVIGSLPDKAEVNYTGNKTKEIDGHMWAEVEYGGNKGWVAADYLSDEKPISTLNKDTANTTVNSNGNTEWKTTPTNSATDNYDERVPVTVDEKNINLSDHSWLIAEFNKVKHPVSQVIGDADGEYGLQCPDVTKWFVKNFTTLQPVKGNGCLQVGRIAAQKDDLEISIIPSAPAVYSIAPKSKGPGIGENSLSHSEAGHTGIVLAVSIANKPEGEDDPTKYTYNITYFHTYSGVKNNAAITTKRFTPSEAVTYVNIGKYLK